MLDIGIRSWEFRTNSQRGFCLLLGPQKRWNIVDYHYICLVARELDQTGKLRLAERVESVPKVLDVIVLLRQASLKYFVEHLYNWETAAITILLAWYMVWRWRKATSTLASPQISSSS